MIDRVMKFNTVMQEVREFAGNIGAFTTDLASLNEESSATLGQLSATLHSLLQSSQKSMEGIHEAEAQLKKMI